MTTTTAAALTDADRERLAAFADLLIPHDDRMPSGSAAGAHSTGLDRVLEVRPDLLAIVVEGLNRLPDPLPASLSWVEPDTFAALRPVADALTSAYFIDPEVARLVGYRTRSIIPIRFDEDLDDLVTHVVARGPIYRPTPEEH